MDGRIGELCVLIISFFCEIIWRDKKLSLYLHLEPNVELIKNEGMKPKDLKKAKALCETFQEDFIEKWHEHMDDNEL